jgi:hypothetical protein
MNAHVAPPELSPLEIDPRPCHLCGLTIDQHIMVDDGEGPEFFCGEFNPDAADIVRLWELDDPRDRWRHIGEVPPIVPAIEPPAARPYRTPQATIDAFLYVTRLDDPEYLARWLADHPRDAKFLLKIWKAKA